MRLAISAAVATSFVALVAGQIADLPECARNCAFPAMPPECGVNPKCICSAKSFIDAMTCCVAKSCNPDEQQKASAIANKVCSAAGINDLPESASCNSASASATATASITGTLTGTAIIEPTGTTASASQKAPTGSTTPSSSPSTTGATASQTPGAGSRAGVAAGLGVGAALLMGFVGVM
ncbi:CFEM domain-containing protein [Histoplasma capsulatum var. duboisii H88]|uniref:CFEM domain-containing protein n=1 Tax=Ajellomyces capsulatus (strain H88) TaxID=544711 RepID=A0A8A1L4I8_AJEC8|nr:CFEM domain-containing protein [Histoplasma capsulatum var. duboisii H88]